MSDKNDYTDAIRKAKEIKGYVTKKNNFSDGEFADAIEKANNVSNQKDKPKGSSKNKPQVIDEFFQTYAQDFFMDQDGNSYVVLNEEKKSTLYNLKSEELVYWILYKIKNEIGVYASESQVKTVINSNMFYSRKNRKRLELRLMNREGVFLIDTCNKRDEAIQVTDDGWKIIPNPVCFRKYDHLHPINPSTKDRVQLNKIFDYINITDAEDRILFLTYIIYLWIPEVEKPILELYGTEGSGKSTAYELIRKLIDPASYWSIRYQKNKEDILRMMYKNYLCFFDNLSRSDSEFDEILARGVTGEIDVRRELYTNDGDVIRSMKRAIGLNGRTITSLKPDVMERKLLIQIHRIAKNSRKEKKELLDEWHSIIPNLQATILDIIVEARKKYLDIDIHLERMADFTRWGEAISQSLGYDQNEFLTAYSKNIGSGAEESALSDPFVNCILAILNDELKQTPLASDGMTPKAILEEVKHRAENLGYSKKMMERLPASPAVLGKDIVKSEAIFEKMGWHPQKMHTGKERVWVFRKTTDSVTCEHGFLEHQGCMFCDKISEEKV